jgi:hypothetical protein
MASLAAEFAANDYLVYREAWAGVATFFGGRSGMTGLKGRDSIARGNAPG